MSVKERVKQLADWESEVNAEIADPVDSPPPVELTYFAGQAMTAEAAEVVAFAASQEGMGG